MSASVLVTGSAGFIGSHLVEHLLEQKKVIVGLDNFDPFYDPAAKRRNLTRAIDYDGFSLIEGDIRDTDLLHTIFKTHSIETVVHLAARAGVRPSIQQPLVYQDVNINGTMGLLEMARMYRVKKFVFASSSSVYGNNTKTPFSETDNVDYPISPYAATKKAGELLCYTYHHLYHFDVACLRFFTAYGPRQRPDMAVHKFTRLIYEGKEVPIFGDGQTRRDYTYIADIVQGIVGSMNYQESGYEIFNLGESQVTPLLPLVRLIETHMGKKASLQYLPEQPGDVKITYADISKARRLLGYAPSTSIETGVRCFVDWFLENVKRET
jgi:UDP-glucuronate 4-epimerase